MGFLPFGLKQVKKKDDNIDLNHYFLIDFE